ncbi:MAG: hypothetical protein KDA61_14155 [Planctomycetales bacterium]|nr:hypothetical protein [Planctomycetales bacterium]
MTSQFDSNDDALGRLVRNAGGPSVEMDSGYLASLRNAVLERVAEGRVSRADSAALPIEVVQNSNGERRRKMNRFLELAVAACVLLAVGGIAMWGGSATIVLADVVGTLDGLKTATYDFRSELRSPIDGTTTIVESKGYFQAPALERVESSTTVGSGGVATKSVMVLDCLKSKSLALFPAQKKAMVINIEQNEPSAGGTASMFSLVRQLVGEGQAADDANVESLGEQQIAGQTVVGFRKHDNTIETTLWADPATAKVVRVEYVMISGGGKMVMSNIEYDVDLDPTLFSLEPPEGYEVEVQSVAAPAEADFVNVLRLVAEYNDRTFPDSLGVNEKTFMLAIQAKVKADSEALLNTPQAQDLMATLKAKYEGDDAGFTDAWMKAWMELSAPITRGQTQKYVSGAMFYGALRPENDSHYIGKGVKLDAPNRPIFWYRPAGAADYRVLFADLSFRAMSAEQVERLEDGEVSPTRPVE